MKKNFFTAIVAGSFLCLSFLQSCVHEALETEIANVQQDPVFYIKSEYMKGKDMVAGKLIEWDKAREYKGEGKIVLVTVPVKNEGSRLIEELTFRIDNGKVSGHIWKFESNSDFEISDYSLTAHEIMGKMTGKVSYISLEGSMRYEKQIVRGELIDEVAKNGSGPMSSPSCKPCHGEIEEVVIPSPGGGTTNPNPGNPSTPIPGGVITNPTNPNNPNPNNPSGTDPCSKIKGQKNSQTFSQKLNDLTNKKGLSKETGYSQRTNGDFTYHDQASANSNSNALSLPKASLPENKDIMGYMHTHVDDFTTTNSDGYEETRTGIKMFSPADVAYFMDMLANAQAAGRPLTDVYAVMVSSNGTYQIRFTGNQYQIKSFTDQQIAGFYEPYKKAMLGSKNPEASFLKFLDEKMNVKATNLYKMNVNASGATSEVKLNPDKTTTSTSNCP